MALGAIAGTLGIIALFEGIAALLEHLEGDPEADVAVALQRLAAKNQRRAFSLAAVEQEGIEDVNKKFARFNRIPSRMLTQAALSRSPGPPIGGLDTGLLDMVSSRMGMPSRQLEQVSHPNRLGDMSSVTRQAAALRPRG